MCIQSVQVKCYQYWPANSEEKRCGSLKLKLTGETVLADFTRRYFELKVRFSVSFSGTFVG